MHVDNRDNMSVGRHVVASTDLLLAVAHEVMKSEIHVLDGAKIAFERLSAALFRGQLLAQVGRFLAAALGRAPSGTELGFGTASGYAPPEEATEDAGE
jgi:hypothetical protein